MAKVDKDNWDKEYSEDELADMQDGVETYPEFEHESLAIRLLYSKLNEAIDLTNTQYDEIALNTAKVGITTSQKNAIIANTAKTGITTAQSSAITANTAKTGISTAQSTQLSQLGKSILECGKGELTFAYDSKTSKLTFTYSEGKTSKKGTLTLS